MVYARRRIEPPQPSAPTRTAPAGDPEEPEPPSEDSSEPDQEEGEEEESLEPPDALPEEEEEVELEIEVEEAGEEAAVEAPQEESEEEEATVASSPKLPTLRGSVARECSQFSRACIRDRPV